MTFDPNSIRIASPCTVPWESMRGDDRTRFCNLCKLNVHNFSAMSEDEIVALIGAGGRVCARLYRRADGTILTRDCPVGEGKKRRRFATLAGAALTAILGLFSVTYGQKVKKTTIKNVINVTHTIESKTIVRGTVFDANRAVVPGAAISIRSLTTNNRLSAMTNEEGVFEIEVEAAERYVLEVSQPGFLKGAVKLPGLNPGDDVNVELELAIDPDVTVEVGIFVDFDEPVSTSSGTTTMSGKILDQ